MPGPIAPDGFYASSGGIDTGTEPDLLPQDQHYNAVNITFQNNLPGTRPGWIKRSPQIEAAIDNNRFLTGNPQGLGVYQSGNTTYLIVSSAGYIYAIDPLNNFKVTPATPSTGPNSKNEPKAYMCQAERFFVIQDGSSKPIILESLTPKRAGDQEVPVGTAMAYNWGRLWVATGNNFVAGDIEGGDTSVISFTDNRYLNEGGAFTLPATCGQLNALVSIPLQDTATGQGQLLVGGDYGIASVNGAIPREQWKDTQIQQITQLGVGMSGQDSNALLNGDIFYRSYDGIRSYRMARAQQGINGNTPQSNEVSYYTNTDTQQFLKYGSATYFNGRILHTTNPVWKGNYCYWKGLLSLNSQPQSNMRQKSPPIWEGMWDGLNIVQIVKGIFNKTERCFALVRFVDDTIISTIKAVDEDVITVDDTSLFAEGEIYETNIGEYFKVNQILGPQRMSFFYITTVDGEGINLQPGQTITKGSVNEIWELTTNSPFDIIGNEKKKIQSKLWTRSFNHGSPFAPKEVSFGEMWVKDVIGEVDWSVKYRPDQYPCFFPWASGTLCSESEVCNEQCPTDLNRHPSYKPQLKLGSPNSQCNKVTSGLSTVGYQFQWLIEWEGHMKIRGVRETADERQTDSKGRDC